MRLQEKAGGAVVIRLGRTGTGRAPNYKLELAANGTFVAAYDGANHKSYDPLPGTGGDTFWSTATMSFDEVEGLLRNIRGLDRPPR